MSYNIPLVPAATDALKFPRVAALGAAWEFVAPPWSTALGGTGLASWTAGDVPYYAAGTVLSKLGIGANTYVMVSNGSAPTWAAAAPTATALATARAINGVNFDGTGAITVPVNNADDTTTAATMYPLWTATAGGNYAAKVSTTKLSFNPSTGLLTATGFSGPLTGNVTGNASGSSGSCTGNAATVTGLSVTAGKTLSVSNSLTLTATDGSTLAIGTGGTLGTAAYTAAAAYEPALGNPAGDAYVLASTALGVRSWIAASSPGAHDLVSATHTAAGLTSGHFLKATGTTTYAFGAHGLTYSDVGAAPAAGNSSIVTVGTLTGGATGAGFTVALTTSTITGTLAAARLPSVYLGTTSVDLARASAALSLADLSVTGAGTWNAGAVTSSAGISATTGTFSGDFAVATTKFTVASATGAATISGSGGGLTFKPRDGSGNDYTFYNPTGDDLRLFNGATDTFVITQAGAATFAAGISATTGTFSGDFSVATSKFTVASATGNAVVAGTLGVTSDFAVATSKFTVAAATGNVVIAGTTNFSGNILPSAADTYNIGSATYFVRDIFMSPTFSGTGTNLLLTSGKQIALDSSSERTKRDIASWDGDVDALIGLQPIEFIYRDTPEAGRVIGFSAERVYDVLPQAVNLDDNGRPFSLRSNALIAALWSVVKRDRARIAALEGRGSRVGNPS